MASERTIVLTVEDRVFAHLTKLATANGRSAARYAQELFEAAYAARCGFGQGDHALEVEVAKIDARRPVAAAAPAPANPAELDRLRRERDFASGLAAKVPELERTIAALEAERDDLRSDAGRVPKLEQTLEVLREERNKAVARATAAERAQAEDENAKVAALEEKLGTLRFDYVAQQEQLNFKIDEALALRQQAFTAETALEEKTGLGAEIEELKQLATVLRDVVETAKSPPPREPAAAPLPVAPQPAAPAEPAVAAPRPARVRTTPKPSKAIWNPKWGRA